jgi:oxygen-independent coproporphyrinogen-3 oxidase
MGRDVARGRLTLPVDDALAEMYALTRDVLPKAGYAQYEISNWARHGCASRHNLTYWRDGAWIGVGAGAASSLGGRRWKNSPVLERYISSIQRGDPADVVEDEQPDAATAMLDYLTLGLRLREGVSSSAFRNRFGEDLLGLCGEELQWLSAGGAIELDGDRVRIAAEHQLVTNEILVRLERPLAEALQKRRATSVSQIAAR